MSSTWTFFDKIDVPMYNSNLQILGANSRGVQVCPGALRPEFSTLKKYISDLSYSDDNWAETNVVAWKNVIPCTVHCQ